MLLLQMFGSGVQAAGSKRHEKFAKACKNFEASFSVNGVVLWRNQQIVQKKNNKLLANWPLTPRPHRLRDVVPRRPRRVFTHGTAAAAL